MAFDWFKRKSEQDDDEKGRQAVRRPQIRDWTEDMVPNVDLLRGLYHNTYPGLKLAGSLAFPAIAVPVYFMGLPIPKATNESAQDALDALHDKFITDEQRIHIHCHREGTIWIWPYFNQNRGRPDWEFISDDVVTDIQKDLYTQDVVRIFTDEQITIRTGYNETQIVRRIREFTPQRVTYRYEMTGGVAGLENRTFRNTLGIMPIPFANNADGGEVRGHSDLGRMLSDLKIYHDTELAQHQVIAKFRPKLVQQVKDVQKWLTNNAIDVSSVNIQALDFILNLTDAERTEFIHLEAVAEPYIETKKQTFHKIVEGQSIPEICWGLKTEGNHASVEEQMAVLANYVEDKKRQKQESYDTLWTATARLASVGMMAIDAGDVMVEWDHMETASDATKAEVFKNYAQGVHAIAGGAPVATKAMIWRFLRERYPNAVQEDETEYTDGIKEMADHKVYAASTWSDLELGLGLDAGGAP